MSVLQRAVVGCLLGISLAACTASSPTSPANNTPAALATPAVTATTEGSASPTPDGDEKVRASIQETLDRFATVYNHDKPELLKQVYDTSNAPLRRLFEDSYAFFRDPVEPGETPTTYRVTTLRRLPYDFMLATITRSRDGYIAEWPFREVSGQWVLAEPTKEQLGERVKTERDGFTFVTYPWADDVNDQLMDVMSEAHTVVKEKLGIIPGTQVEVRIQPAFGAAEAQDATTLAYYQALPSGRDRIVIYTPQSLVSGFYNPQGGWKAYYRYILSHEYTHFVTNRAFVPTIKLSEWMSEGIAEYVSDDASPERIRAALRENKLLPLIDTATTGNKRDLDHFTGLGSETDLGYALSYELVAYIVEQHGGLDGFWKLCRTYADNGGRLDEALQASFGTSAEAFERDWRAWLEKRYGS